MVLLRRPVKFDIAADQVVDYEFSLARHFETDDAAAPFRLELAAFLFGIGGPAAAVAERPFRGNRRFPFLLKFFGPRVIAIGESPLQQFVDRCLILVVSLRLVVRPVRPADSRSLIPVDSEPFQAVQDRLERFFDIPRLVSVVNPQNEFPAVFLGEQVAEERRADPSDMEVAGRARGKTGTDFGRHRVNPSKDRFVEMFADLRGGGPNEALLPAPPSFNYTPESSIVHICLRPACRFSSCQFRPFGLILRKIRRRNLRRATKVPRRQLYR